MNYIQGQWAEDCLYKELYTTVELLKIPHYNHKIKTITVSFKGIKYVLEGLNVPINNVRNITLGVNGLVQENKY